MRAFGGHGPRLVVGPHATLLGHPAAPLLSWAGKKRATAPAHCCEQAFEPNSVKNSKLKRMTFFYFPEAEFDAF
jgi:hypothetical protein